MANLSLFPYEQTIALANISRNSGLNSSIVGELATSLAMMP